MRALAAELGVQAPTLYWHVKSKRDIFRAMAVAMTRDASALVTTADRGVPWRERLVGWAHALRRSMLSHRDGARVFAGTFAPEPATFDVTESALQALQDAGLSIADAAQRTILLRHFIVGFCIEEQELSRAARRTGSGSSRRTEDSGRFRTIPTHRASLARNAEHNARGPFRTRCTAHAFRHRRKCGCDEVDGPPRRLQPKRWPPSIGSDTLRTPRRTSDTPTLAQRRRALVSYSRGSARTPQSTLRIRCET